MRRKTDTKGASLVEYGILTGLIVVGSITAVLSLGNDVKDTFDTVGDTLASEMDHVSALQPDHAPGTGTGETRVPAAAECLDPANIGTVGTVGWTGCENMLIVDNTMMARASSANYWRPVMGDGSFDFKPSDSYTFHTDGITYTMQDDGNNIFTGQVTDLDSLFSRSTFNEDIGYWDVSNVDYFAGVFEGTPFNHDLSGWDVSKGEWFSGMFDSTSAFNQDISSWDMSSATNLDYMFYGSQAFQGDLSTWNVSSVTDMQEMFGWSTYNGDISDWNVGNVTRMGGMFRDNESFNQDLSSWCVSNFTEEPTNWSLNTTSYTAPKPVWGTCP